MGERKDSTHKQKRHEKSVTHWSVGHTRAKCVEKKNAQSSFNEGHVRALSGGEFAMYSYATGRDSHYRLPSKGMQPFYFQGYPFSKAANCDRRATIKVQLSCYDVCFDKV